MVLDAGSRWDRFDFVWPVIEPSNDNYVFSGYDILVSELYTDGLDMVGILLWTPDWAATSGRSTGETPSFDRRPPGWYTPSFDTSMARTKATAASSPPQGLYLDWDDPGNYWGDFVYDTVLHFKDRVQHWEIWNEPEWDYFWTGTSTDYAQLLKIGYQATKAACPECTVLFGGLHYWANPNYYRWVLNTVSQDPDASTSNYFFDVMSVHLYSGSDNAYSIVNQIRSGMTSFVPDHPIWLTETGVAVWNDYTVDPDPIKYDYASTEQEAALYVLQSYANAWASGVDKYFFFRANDEDMGEYFGLIRNDKSLRPAYVAFQVATNYLVTPTLTTRWTYGDGTRRVTLWGTPRGKLSVLWNTSPTPTNFDYQAILPTATLVDRWGVTQTITATAGTYSLSLAGATANLVSDPSFYIIGGETYLVIEDDTSPPTVTIDSLPTTTYSDTISVSWDGGDGETGIWGFEVEVKEGSGGEWTDWLFVTPSYSGGYTEPQHNEQYCFRVRSWDDAGNYSAWTGDTEACTTVDLDREVYFNLGVVYGDENGNGVQDGAEVSMTAQLRFVNSDSTDVITPAIGSSWQFTVTLLAGDHVLIATPTDWPSLPPGWLPRWESIPVPPGPSTEVVAIPSLGLLPHRTSLFMPVVHHNTSEAAK
jgi:hypothetical protein